jgi:hypothetical protein
VGVLENDGIYRKSASKYRVCQKIVHFYSLMCSPSGDSVESTLKNKSALFFGIPCIWMLIFYIFHHFQVHPHTRKPTTFLIANKRKKIRIKKLIFDWNSRGIDFEE